MSQEGLRERQASIPPYVTDIERGPRNVGMVNIDRMARALSVDLPTLTSEWRRSASAVDARPHGLGGPGFAPPLRGEP